MRHYFEVDFGNEGSRTHEYGVKAKNAVQRAREEVARAVDAEKDEIIFTSGATEANNLAILGLSHFGEQQGKKHIVSTQIEHKAVLEPLEELNRRGFEVSLIPVGRDGRVAPTEVLAAVRADTLLVSVMHANNETGIIQPINEIADGLLEHPGYFHVDAAQTFGKWKLGPQIRRVDLMSISGHKIYGPKGVGALVARKRGFKRPPLTPLQFGGGQERGLRPGTLPVPLIAGFGIAAKLAMDDKGGRRRRCEKIRSDIKKALLPLGAKINGNEDFCLPHVLNLSFPGIDSEALMLALKSLVAISNGSACTSATYQPSHVLAAMGLLPTEIAGAIRLSWSHLTPEVPWEEIARIIREF